MQYQYNLANQLIKMTYPSGRVINYQRDDIGQITGVTSQHNKQTQPLASAIKYQPFGAYTELTFGNALKETRNYDLDGRLTKITLPNIIDRQYQYDANSNIKQIDYPTPSNHLGFDYDALNRLTSTTGTTSHQYSYDEVGNRLSLIQRTMKTNTLFF